MSKQTTKPSDGGPAFPCPHAGYPCYDGMSLRDWFAGQALSASYMGDYTPEEMGALAYQIADFVLKERAGK